jgi:hypothetical protein
MGVAVLAAAFAVPAIADACSFSNTAAQIQPALKAIEKTPPVFPAAGAVRVKRGQSPRSGCGDSDATSCDDLGTIQIEVAASDDTTPAARMGYEVTLARGTLPDGLVLPAVPIERVAPGHLMFVWLDGATDSQEPVDFTLRIVAVDGAGNESAPQLVSVDDAGSGGCRLANRGGSGDRAILGALALLALARRRRPERRLP